MLPDACIALNAQQADPAGHPASDPVFPVADSRRFSADSHNLLPPAYSAESKMLRRQTGDLTEMNFNEMSAYGQGCFEQGYERGLVIGARNVCRRVMLASG